jgi:hypothetical protein
MPHLPLSRLPRFRPFTVTKLPAGLPPVVRRPSAAGRWRSVHGSCRSASGSCDRCTVGAATGFCAPGSI